MNKLIRQFEETAQRYAGKPALIQDERQIAYGELLAAVERTAAALEHAGLRAATRIALDGVNDIEFVIAYLAVAKLGACVVPIDSRLSAAEVEMQLADCTPNAYVLLRDDTPLARALDGKLHLAFATLPGHQGRSLELRVEAARLGQAQALEGDLVIQYSSGSTGKPKGIVLSSDNIYHKVSNWNATLEIGPDDVFLCTLTLSHCYGMYVHTLAGLLAGGTVYLPNLASLTPGRILRMLAEYRVTVFGSLPYMYQLWLAVPPERVQLDSVRYLISGSAPLPEVTAYSFRDKFGRNINQVYGLTEIGLITFNKDAVEPMSLGRLTANMECRIVDENGRDCGVGEPGELVVRCASMARGYLNNPDDQREMFKDGWLHTKDVVKRAADGSFVMCGRLSQFINVGGNKVSPSEVENALLSHQAVKEAAVVGQRSTSTGEEVVAFVVLDADRPQPSAKELFQHCAGNLSSYKQPRTIHVIDALPKSPLGKVLKSQLFANPA